MQLTPAILTAVASGDADAAAELLKSIWPDAFRIAWSILGERTAAEDAAQEACARALVSIGNLRRPESFAAWFYRIAVNEANRCGRAANREIILAAETSVAKDASPEDRMDVLRAIDALEPALRLTIVLRYYYDLNSAEIARIVGTSAVTVRWRIMIAHRRLRGLLESPKAASENQELGGGTHADEPQTIA